MRRRLEPPAAPMPRCSLPPPGRRCACGGPTRCWTLVAAARQGARPWWPVAVPSGCSPHRPFASTTSRSRAPRFVEAEPGCERASRRSSARTSGAVPAGGRAPGARNPWVAAWRSRRSCPTALRVALDRAPPGGPAALAGEGWSCRRDGAADRAVASSRRFGGPAGWAPGQPRFPSEAAWVGALATSPPSSGACAGLGGTLSAVEVLGEDDFRLHTGALPFPLLVTRGTLGALPALATSCCPSSAALPAIEQVDLRFAPHRRATELPSPRRGLERASYGQTRLTSWASTSAPRRSGC
jgi:hypothetical protein